MNIRSSTSTKASSVAKPGYKHTKLGWIPEEWEVMPLTELSERIMVGIASAATHAYREKGVLLLRNQNILEGKIDESDLLYIDETYELLHKNKRLHPGDVITMRTGYPGVSAVVPEHLAGSQCFTSLITRPSPRKLDGHFLAYYNNSPIGKKIISAMEIGGAQKNFNSSSLEKLPVLTPPLPEQRRIAQVLGAWDRAIATVQQLLAVQQERKRELMQELLTGRRRFKGFGGKWKECELGELGQFRTSSVDKKLVEGQKRVRLVNYMDVYNNQRIHGGMPLMEVTAKDSQRLSSSLRRGDILFTPSSETPDDIGHSAVVVDDMDNTLFSYHVMRFRPHDDTLDLDFRAYVFNNAGILKQFSAKATGSTRYTLSASDFGDTLVSFPSDKAEQQAIARMLMACDAEINVLTNQLDHLTNQKRGLMQQLLTGAVRVQY